MDRHDTDAILEQVRRSNRHVVKLEMERCQGSANKAEVNGDILARILENCPKLCYIIIVYTTVEGCEFYTLLGQLADRVIFFTDRQPRKEMLCYLKARAKLPVPRK
jgi:hypothetical protein